MAYGHMAYGLWSNMFSVFPISELLINNWVDVVTLHVQIIVGEDASDNVQVVTCCCVRW